MRTQKRRNAFLHSVESKSRWDQPIIANWSAGALLPVVLLILTSALVILIGTGAANHWFELPNSPLTAEAAKYLIR